MSFLLWVKGTEQDSDGTVLFGDLIECESNDPMASVCFEFEGSARFLHKNESFEKPVNIGPVHLYLSGWQFCITDQFLDIKQTLITDDPNIQFIGYKSIVLRPGKGWRKYYPRKGIITLYVTDKNRRYIGILIWQRNYIARDRWHIHVFARNSNCSVDEGPLYLYDDKLGDVNEKKKIYVGDIVRINE